MSTSSSCKGTWGTMKGGSQCTFLFPFIIVIIALGYAPIGCDAEARGDNVDHNVRYKISFTPGAVQDMSRRYPNLPDAEAFYFGQEIRMRVTLTSATNRRLLLNTSQFRVGIVNAYTGRALTGTSYVSCRAVGSSDLWADYKTVTAASFVYGTTMALEGFVTFTIPPFPFRVCIQGAYYAQYNRTSAGMDTPGQYGEFPLAPNGKALAWLPVNDTRKKGTTDSTWQEVLNYANRVIRVNTTVRYVWQSSLNMYEGDYAAIRIFQNGFRHVHYIPSQSRMGDGDLVKLVPAGYPCTYERLRDYCGANVANRAGTLLKERCATEGSVAGGVANVGTNAYNPLGSKPGMYPSKRLLDYPDISGGTYLVAYLRLPAAGTYDVCYSPLARRVYATNTSVSMWFKVYQTQTGCPQTATQSLTQRMGCTATNRLIISANVDTLRWSASDRTAGSWGTIQFTSPTATLSSTKATTWEYSSTPEYYTTVGGDQFRLVDDAKFIVPPVVKGTNNLLALERTSTSTTVSYGYQKRFQVNNAGTSAGSETTVMNRAGTPDLGTILDVASDVPSSLYGGCWNSFNDNFGAYSSGLNGIVSSMNNDAACCYTATNTYCSNPGCKMSNDGPNGPSVSGDLGGDPRTRYGIAFDGSLQLNTWAYVRFPTGKRWRVCYRKAGTENWRSIPDTNGNYILDLTLSTMANYTYMLNDTRAETWGPMIVSSNTKTLNTLDWNYWSSPTQTAVGSTLKIIHSYQSCQHDSGRPGADSIAPGLVECTVGACRGATTCANCFGSADESDTLRFQIAFYIRVPPTKTDGTFYRVCFRQGSQNWREIFMRGFRRQGLMTSRKLFNSLPAPWIDFSLKNATAGSLGKFVFRRRAGSVAAFNTNPQDLFGGGDIFRLVPNKTKSGEVQCDITWGASSGTLAQQNFDPTLITTDLGVYCTSVFSSGDASAACYTTRVNPTSNKVPGNYPYTTSNPNHNGWLSNSYEGTMGFITLPAFSTTSLSYKLCYKQRNLNWVELKASWGSVPAPLVVVKPRSYAFTLVDSSGNQVSKVYGGTYGYILIYNDVIRLDSDLVKLVKGSNNCAATPEGTPSYGNQYASFSWRSLSGSTWIEESWGGQVFVPDTAPAAVQATLGSRGLTTRARAYFNFPVTQTNGRVVDNTYRVCFMPRELGSDFETNWFDLGSITVTSIGIHYAVQNTPTNMGVLRVQFRSSEYLLNSMSGNGDAAKIIVPSQPCIGSEWDATKRPNGITSTHVGQELTKAILGRSQDNTTIQEAGIVDLGPDDRFPAIETNFDVTLPYATDRTYYKVCYKPKGLPWMELPQSPLPLQPIPMPAEGIYTVVPIITNFVMDAKVMGIEPFSGGLYKTGATYPSVAVAGMATMSNTSGANISLLYATSSVTTFANTRYKFVLLAVQSGVTYDIIPKATCNSDGVMEGVVEVYTFTLASIVTNLPMTPGRYLLCLKPVGTNTWLFVKEGTSSASVNPITIISSELKFFIADGNVTVTDSFAAAVNSNFSPLGALSNADRVYFIPANGVCGITSGIASAVGDADKELSQPPDTNVYAQRSGNTLLPTAVGTFMLCYKRSQKLRTMSADVVAVPFVGDVWMQLLQAEGDSARGGGTQFYLTTVPARPRILSCPYSNRSVPLKAGRAFDILVGAVDLNGVTVPTSSYIIDIDTNSEFTTFNAKGTCALDTAPLFGWSATNTKQWTQLGITKYSVTITSGCPNNLCRFRFVGSNGASSGSSAEPQYCSVYVGTTIPTNIVVDTPPSSCTISDPACVFQIRALDRNSETAFTATDDITVIASNFAANGLSLKVGGRSLSDTSGSVVGKLKGGVLVVPVEFDVTDGLTFATDKVITFRVSLNGLVTQFTLVVVRPVLTRVTVVDLYPVQKTYDGVDPQENFVRPHLIPSWEPVTTGNDPYWSERLYSQVVAAPNRHIVAQQYYAAVIRGWDQFGRPMDRSKLLAGTQISMAVTYSDPFAGKGNQLISPSCTSENCETPFSTAAFSTPKQLVQFRFKNSLGCDPTCVITMKFNNADLPGGAVSITTPVRSGAIKLKATCWLPPTGADTTDETKLGTAGPNGGCPQSSVEIGWTVKLTAIDQFGATDVYFEGAAIPLLTQAVPDPALSIATVPLLQQPQPPGTSGVPPGNVTFTFVRGVAWMHRITITKPCVNGCGLEVATSWGTDILNMGPLRTNRSTTKLKCALKSPMFQCQSLDNVPGSSCATVVGLMTYNSVNEDTNKNGLVYADTTICASISAVNERGVNTMYDTNWVMYYVQTVPANSGKAITIVDVGSSPSRVRAMQRGTVDFCFNVYGEEKLQFRVFFAAQRFNDPGYWSKQSGDCSLGTFTYWPLKHVAKVVVTSVQLPFVSLTTLPSSLVHTYTQRIDTDKTDPATKLTFQILDHYNNVIDPLSLETAQTLSMLIPTGCSAKTISSCLTAGSAVSSTYMMSIYPSGDARETGVVTLIVNSATVNLNSDLQYTFTMQKWCLGCYMEFRIRTETNSDYKTSNAQGAEYSPIATVYFNVLMPASSSRLLAFKVGTSPFTTYWQRWEIPQNIGQLTVRSDLGNIAMFLESCFTTNKALCDPVESWFLPSMCDDIGDNSSVLASSNKLAPIQMYVIATTDTTKALTSTFEPQCSSAANCSLSTNVVNQVDILNSYAVSVKIGQQQLSCVGIPCSKDGTTTPTQIVPALGATLADAVRAYTDTKQIPTTSFLLKGNVGSDYYSVTSDFKTVRTAPLMNGSFAATAVGVQGDTLGRVPTQITSPTGYIFAFRGARAPQRIAVKDAAQTDSCLTSPMVPCLLGDIKSCPYDGYPKVRQLDSMNITYAFNNTDNSGVLPVGVPVPFTVQIEDANGKRVSTARGTVTVELLNQKKCNDGGSITIQGEPTTTVSITNGKRLLWVTFSAPCESCSLRFTLRPDDSQRSNLYATFVLNRAAHIAETNLLQIKDLVAGAGTHAIMLTPPNMLPSSLFVRDAITIEVGAAFSFQGIMIRDPRPVGDVAVYNIINDTAPSSMFSGNGGVLRSTPGITVNSHHDAIATFSTTTGTATLTFRFSRVCPRGCSVLVVYNVNGRRGTFILQNQNGTLFTVRANANSHLLMGLRPRRVQAKSDFAVAMWHVDMDETTKEVYGVGRNVLPQSGMLKKEEDGSNGDGGDVTTLIVSGSGFEVQRFSAVRSCNRCRLTFRNDSFAINIFTTATRLRVDPVPGASYQASYPMKGYFTYNVFAVDDFGFTDVWFGGYDGGAGTPCFGSLPFECSLTSKVQLTAGISSDGSTLNVLRTSYTIANLANAFLAPDGNNSLSNGQGFSILMGVDGPVREGMPYFVAKGLTSLTARPEDNRTPRLEVSVGGSAVYQYIDITPNATTSVLSMIQFTATLAQWIPALSTSLISPIADNIVTVSLGTDCPNFLNKTERFMTFTYRKGYVTGNFTLSEMNKPYVMCPITFTTGAGSATCASDSSCTFTYVLNVTSLSVSEWVFLRPTFIENGGLPFGVSGPMFGAVKRRTYVTVGLQTTVQGVSIPVKLCDDPNTPNVVENCTLIVGVSPACEVMPDIDNTVIPIIDGIAKVSLKWNVHPRNNPTYLCPLTMNVTRSILVNGSVVNVTLPPARPRNITVTVCTPSRVVYTTNTSALYKDQVLVTGRPYTFAIAMVDAKGQICRGDSQEDATELRADVVTSGTIFRNVPFLQVINTNTTGFVTADGVKDTVRAVGGEFSFQLYFSNSSLALGISGIRIRVSATSITPEINNYVLSASFDTVIMAQTLTFNRATPLPRYWVTGRPIRTAGGSKTVVAIQAVDGLNPLWAPKYLPTSPNIAARPMEKGSDVKVFWNVDPLPPSGFPLTFTNGLKEVSLVRGEAAFTFSWTGEDADVQLYVSTSTNVSILPTQAARIKFQSIKNLFMGKGCRTDCIVANVTNTTSMNVSTLQVFYVSVYIADGKGDVVLGDDDSVVRSVITTQPGSSVYISQPPSFTTKGEFEAKVVAGVATFPLAFLGAPRPDETVQIKLFCPPTRRVVGTNGLPQDVPNPCYGINDVITKGFAVFDKNVAQSAWTSPSVASTKSIVKVPTRLPSLTLFNVTDFKIMLSSKLSSKFQYINSNNADSVIDVNACEVSRVQFGYADFSADICSNCAQKLQCPTGVIRCKCSSSSASSSTLMKHYMRSLLQSDVEVQIELSVNLQNAVGFSATSTQAISSEYTSLSTFVEQVLRTDASMSRSFAIDTTNVNSRSSVATPAGATPTPQPVIATPPPTLSPPNATLPPSEGSAQRTVGMMVQSLLFTLLCSLLLVLV